MWKSNNRILVSAEQNEAVWMEKTAPATMRQC